MTGWGTQLVFPLNGHGATFTKVAAGYGHSLALKPDGTVVAWGRNVGGESGVPAGLSDVMALAAGYGQSLALKSDGTVVGWGGWFGAQVPSGLTGGSKIASGQGQGLALKQDGTVVAWGWDAFGQSTVPAGLSGVVAVAAGEVHSLAVRLDGTVLRGETIGMAKPRRLPD